MMIMVMTGDNDDQDFYLHKTELVVRYKACGTKEDPVHLR